ncbi:MAG: MgtC/SapB family protein [Alphaproteobacteria bacterium]|nr:MgtC/SapB family protein [Alphaproteobacteria bacterium]
MDTLDLFQRLGVALAIGLLIGLERGWQDRKGSPGSRTAGTGPSR